MQQKRLMYLTFEYIISIFNNPPFPEKKTPSFPSPNILCIPSARFRHILKENKKNELLRSAQQ